MVIRKWSIIIDLPGHKFKLIELEYFRDYQRIKIIPKLTHRLQKISEFGRKWSERFQGVLGGVVQSRVKITQGKCEIWIQMQKLKKQIQLNSFGLQSDDWML